MCGRAHALWLWEEAAGTQTAKSASLHFYLQEAVKMMMFVINIHAGASLWGAGAWLIIRTFFTVMLTRSSIVITCLNLGCLGSQFPRCTAVPFLLFVWFAVWQRLSAGWGGLHSITVYCSGSMTSLGDIYNRHTTRHNASMSEYLQSNI